MNLVLRASLLRYPWRWVIELSKDLISNPCPRTHLPESNCFVVLSLSPSQQPAEHIFIWERGSSIPWASSTRVGTCLAPAATQLCFHNHLPGSNRDTSSAKTLLFLLGVCYWCYYGSHLQLRPLKSGASLCANWGNFPIPDSQHKGALPLFIPISYLSHLCRGTSSHCATQPSNQQHLKHRYSIDLF